MFSRQRAAFYFCRKEVMTKLKKRILTVDDLFKFCQEQQFSRFSSTETGYRLAVKIPTTFEVDDDVDENHRGMARLKIRIFHTGLNRNKSYVSKEAATKAMNTIADRPVLAAIHQLDSGEWDFEGHEIEVVENENGEEEYRYIESQVGSFSSEPAFWETVDDKEFVCAYAYISKEYTKAYDIIKRKNGTKNSCELFIDELAYNAKEKYLDLIDFYVSGSTLLGSRDDGTEIGEGMEGSRADLVDFSVENNSVRFNKDEKLIEILEKLNNVLSNFDRYQIKEGGNQPNMKFEELLEKYGKVAEDITFDYSGMSDEDLEAEFKKLFEEDQPSNEEGEGEVDPEPETDPETDPEVEPEPETEPEVSDPEPQQFEKIIRKYEISHEDIRWALYTLLEEFEVADNEWYFINSVYDTYFTYENWNGDKIFGQAYAKDGDNVTFDGERYTLHRELLTDSEYAELQSIRANYSELKEFKENFEKNELRTQKEAIANSDKYAVICGKDEEGKYANEAFSKLMDEIDNYSLADFETQIKVIHSDFIAENSTFAEKPEEKKPATSVKIFTDVNGKTKKPSRYGNLFKNKNN